MSFARAKRRLHWVINKWPTLIAMSLAAAITVVGVIAVAAFWPRQTPMKKFAASQHLKALSSEEVAGIASRTPQDERPYLKGQVFRAQGDIDLSGAPKGERLVIELPEGKKWTGGEYGTVVLLRQWSQVVEDGQTVDSYAVFYDEWCQLALDGWASWENCANPAARQPGDFNKAKKSYRPLKLKDLDARPVWPYDSVDMPAFAFITTGPITLLPLSLPPSGQPLELMVAAPDHLKGGVFGKTTVVAKGSLKKYRDNICRYLAAKETKQPYHPGTFAPKEQTERRNDCQD